MFTIEQVRTARSANVIKKEIKDTLCGKKLGAGAFAEVYEAKRDDSLVIKIGDEAEDGYWFFIEALATQKTQNRYFPKIYRAIEYINTGRRPRAILRVVVMEKLERFERSGDHSMNAQVANTFDVFLKNLIHANEKVAQEAVGVCTLLGAKIEKPRSRKTISASLLFEEPVLFAVTLPAALYDAAMALKAKFKTTKELQKKQRKCHSIDLDFHENNVMWRVKGKKQNVVITDPFTIW